MKTKILGLLAVGLLAGPTMAQAAPVQWSLNYANNGSGSLYTLSGSFSYDADTNVFSSINVFGDDKAGFFRDSTYTFTDPADPAVFRTATDFRFWDSLAADRTDAQYLDFSLGNASLTNAGGVISLMASLDSGTPFRGVFAARCLNAACTATRTSVIVNDPDPADGSLVGIPISVPEPGTLALVGLSLAGLGLRHRRKTA